MPPRIDPTLLPKSPNLRHERALWANGALWVAGVDEAGRGALAGPVSAAAVVFPQIAGLPERLPGVRDSKQMTADQRETWAHIITRTAVTYAVGMASAPEIDLLGIMGATQLAISRALSALAVWPDYLLVDFIRLPDIPIPQIPLVKGDLRSLSIAAASILAKTSRDALLVESDQKYPGYGLATHKGYGTRLHLEAIERLGPSPFHRFSFASVTGK
jgi:ribonuclease HII